MLLHNLTSVSNVSWRRLATHPIGQSKLSKARAATRRAAIASPSTSVEAKLLEPKPMRIASVANEAVDQRPLETSKAPRDLWDHSADGNMQNP